MRAEGESGAQPGADHAEEADGGEADGELVAEVTRELPMLRGTDPDQWDSLCVVSKRPESLQELNALHDTRAVPRLAPYGVYQDGAALAAARQARTLNRAKVAGTGGRAALYGKGPLNVDDPRFTEVNGLGLHRNMGRIDSYAYDPKAGRLWAAVGNGGIWRSDDNAGQWVDATGNLPTTVTGAVAWSQAKGGTVLAMTGEPTFGASAFTGLGAYWSSDLGQHWKRSKGVPSGALGFAFAVDPKNQSTVYAATQYGLFVSRDAGRSYTNAKLPTGKCAGVTDMGTKPECALANVVTDVVVVQPGGVDTTTKAGTVVATVGWRGGQRANPDGSIQSPNNGVYRSTTGKPGSFAKLAATGFAPQANIGRIELGNAVGPEQDHDVLYALVQDADLLNKGGYAGIDVPDGTPANPLGGGTVLNGLYVSTDFGATWTELVSGTQLTLDPTTGSALIGLGTATGYQPGVQSWYNQWVQPDPTRATASGVPTRLAFGLEEIWTNDGDQAGLPLDGSVPVHFGVVGKYFGGNSCLLLSAGLPACPTDRDPTDSNDTTHPDQQDGLWYVDKTGNLQLIVGNDGGSYRYQFENDSDGELDNAHWGPGNQAGFDTLMPYYAAVANDGTVYAGLQDNGNLKIEGKTRKQYETYGGDGFFAAVDPFDSDVSYEEYTSGAISVTTDGGSTWTSIDPGLTAAKFANPFSMDPTDANHLLTAGREVVETLNGPSTTSGMTDVSAADGTTTTWLKVFDLGTRQHPGDAAATATATDPNNSMSAVTTRGNASYVAYCGQCDTLNKLGPDKASVFQNGIATNVGGSKAGKAGTANGWHVVKTKGLPNRYITSLAIDPSNAKKVYATLGGYTRRWVPAGAVGDANRQIGTGHLYVSKDAGRTWRDVSGNLPDSPASWVTLRKGQLLVGTDVGAFATSQTGTRSTSPRFARLQGLPAAPVASIELKPNNPNQAFLALFGRDVWTYTFANKVKLPPVPVKDNTVPAISKTAASWSFDDGADGWTADTGLFSWALGTPGHGQGTAEDASGQAWALAGPTAYQDNVDTSVTSPAATLPAGTGVLQWSMRLDTEGGLDTVKAEVSTDGGTTWKPVGTYSGKNPDNGDGTGWSTYRAKVPAGGPIQVRFHFTSDALCSSIVAPVGCTSSTGYDGVHVDDVQLGTA